MTDRIVDPLLAAHAMETARRLYAAARADARVYQQPLALTAQVGALVIDPYTGEPRIIRYIEHILDEAIQVTRAEIV
jgi:hypothetical protein